MLATVLPLNKIYKAIPILLAAFFAGFIGAQSASAAEITAAQNNGNLGIIKGIVRDEAGSPIAEATVAIFRVGSAKLLKQVRSAADGSFLAKILPGTYSILAVAQGYNAVTLSEVEVSRSAELNYGFKLERAGSGNTLPEKRLDRNSSRYPMRTAQMQRSVYQATEGKTPIDETADAKNAAEQTDSDPGDSETRTKRPAQTVVETYFASSGTGNYSGLNFARLQNIGSNAEIIFVGQTGTNKYAPERFQTELKFRPNTNNQIRFTTAFAKLGHINIENQSKTLNQVSVQGTDEWKIKEGIILVFGLDYSKFVGAGRDFSISPRLGFQFDINSKTRFRSAYTAPTEERGWQNAVQLEGAQIVFQQPIAEQDFVLENDQPKMNKNRRLEFGIERVLDNKSNVEAGVFFDTVENRGIGAEAFLLDSSGNEGFSEFIANQQGKARGARVVYSRRLNGIFSASAGFAAGNSQKLSKKAISAPANIFENAFAQTVFGQFDADFKTGTQVDTVFRLSPQATIFAIDPFEGKMAIYDPGLSVKVTQTLPNLGLPIHAEAIIDGRNLFDFQPGIEGEEGSLKLNLQRRKLRGGILVRF